MKFIRKISTWLIFITLSFTLSFILLFRNTEEPISLLPQIIALALYILIYSYIAYITHTAINNKNITLLIVVAALILPFFISDKNAAYFLTNLFFNFLTINLLAGLLYLLYKAIIDKPGRNNILKMLKKIFIICLFTMSMFAIFQFINNELCPAMEGYGSYPVSRRNIITNKCELTRTVGCYGDVLWYYGEVCTIK